MKKIIPKIPALKKILKYSYFILYSSSKPEVKKFYSLLSNNLSIKKEEHKTTFGLANLLICDCFLLDPNNFSIRSSFRLW